MLPRMKSHPTRARLSLLFLTALCGAPSAETSQASNAIPGIAVGPGPAANTEEDSRPVVSIGTGGFRVRSADGESSIRIGGRLQADAAFHSPDSTPAGELGDGTHVRRARFELKGTLPNDLRWAAEVDFAGNTTAIKDFWVALDREGPRATFGHQKQPFSLGVEMSSNDIPFVERGIDNFLVIPFVDRAVGLRLDGNTDHTFWAAGIYGESIRQNAPDDEGYGTSGRYVVAPIRDENKVLHLAARGAYRAPDGLNEIDISDETTQTSNYSVVDTGTISDVNGVMLYGGEIAYAHGPASITAEFNQASVDRDGEDFDFSSWHVESTWSLTGESRAKAYRIDAGEFKRLRSETEGGAWEVAGRFATIDLNDGSISGGEEDAVSLALNWYATPNLRLMLDWTHILDTAGGGLATGEAENVDIFTFRAQLTF